MHDRARSLVAKDEGRGSRTGPVAQTDDVTIILSVPQTGSAAGLRLRLWRPDDLPILVAAQRDPVLRRWPVTSLADESAARQRLDAQVAGWNSLTRFSSRWWQTATTAPPSTCCDESHAASKAIIGVFEQSLDGFARCLQIVVDPSEQGPKMSDSNALRGQVNR
jgi:hypothetical protein